MIFINSLIIPKLFLLSVITLIFSIVYCPLEYLFGVGLSLKCILLLIGIPFLIGFITFFCGNTRKYLFKYNPLRLTLKNQLWEGRILPIFRRIFSFTRHFSFITICSFYFEGRWEKHESKRRRHNAVDIYILFWLIISIVFISLSNIFDYNNILKNLVIVLAIYRLFDGFQFWIGDYILRNTGLENANRTLLLTFLEYLEIIIWFATLVFINKESFVVNDCGQHITGMQQAWYYALSSGTIGSNIEPISAIGYTLFTVQIVFAVLFLTVVISRIIGIMKSNNN